MTSPTWNAWVPESSERGWGEAAEIAISWVEQRCAEQRAKGLLLTPVLSTVSGNRALEPFTARHSVATPKSPGRGRRGDGPVLAYVPDGQMLDLAIDFARGSALCVVEASMYPMHGWARAVGALDLTSPENPPEVLSSDVSSAVERLVFFGNNGYGPKFDADRAVSVLRDLDDAGMLDVDEVIGATLALGVSHRGARRLRELAQKNRVGEARGYW